MIVYILDTSVLSSFARAGRIEVLAGTMAGARVVTTREVLDELRAGLGEFPEISRALNLPWLEEVNLSGLAAMGVFAEYSRRLGSSTLGDVGEATVLAWAELNGAVAILDERAGRNAAKERRVHFKGSLWLLSQSVEKGLLSLPEAAQVVDEFRAIGVYLPCSGATFHEWAQAHGLIAR